MKFLKENLILILILLVSVFLRINYDTFIKGYNFDELAMVSIASLKFPFEILKNCANLDYHAPLYYLIAHFFTYFDNEWLCLRLFNVFLALCNVFVFYKIGNLKNKETGLILASIMCVNHLEIGVSNFVKFYCLCFLIFSTVVYFFIKVLKFKKDYIALGISNLFFILSSTFGIFFVLIEYFFLFIIQKRKVLKSFLIAIFGFILYLPILLKQTQTALSNIISPHDAHPGLSWFALYDFLNDYFSPLTNYSCNLYTVEARGIIARIFINFFNENPVDYVDLFSILFFSFLPVLFSSFLVIFAIKKSSSLRIVFYIGLSYFMLFIGLCLIKITGFIPLYIYPFGIILLIFVGVGLSKIQNKKVKYILLSYLILSNLLISNYYPIEKRTDEKAKIFYCFEKYMQHTDKNTIIIATTGGRFLEKYYKNNRIFNFDYEQIGASHNKKLFEIIYGEKIAKKANKNNIREVIKPVILNKIKNPDFEKYIKTEIADKLKKGQKVIYAFNCDESPYVLTENEIKQILLSDNYLNNLRDTSLLFELKQNKEQIINQFDVFEAIQSYSNECLIEILEKYLKRTAIEQYVRTIDDDYKKIVEVKKINQTTLWITKNAVSGWIFVTYEKQ